jgi:HD-GYP domain-containing protein (c-di-GMP phosphodiesterase class II)
MEKAAAPARHPLFVPYYGLMVAAAGLYLILDPPSPVHAPWTGLVVTCALMILADLVPVRMTSGGFVTPGASLDFAALLVFGGPWTAALNVVATLVSQLLVRRQSVLRTTFNAALYVLMIAGAWGVLRALGGQSGRIDVPGDLWALAACAFTYFLIDGVGLSTVLALTGEMSVWRVFQVNFLQTAFHHLSYLALGALGAMLVLTLGPWALALLMLPLLLASVSFRRYFEMKRDLLEFVRALAEVLEEVDPYPRRQSVRVAEDSKRIGRALGMSERAVQDLEYGALLHDLGKVGRQYQHILGKPGRLSTEEQATMRAHPGLGADIVAKVRALRVAAAIVRTHHERPDGLGYPAGLHGDQIPLGARVVSVADAFDAMTSDRPYRRAMSADRAVAALKKHVGPQFDGPVVEALERLIASGRFPILHRTESVEETLDLPPARREA